MRWLLALAAVITAATGCVAPSKQGVQRSFGPAYDDAALKASASPTLEKFESEAAFVAYLRRMRDLAKVRGAWWQFGQTQSMHYARMQRPPISEPQGLQHARLDRANRGSVIRYAQAQSPTQQQEVPCPPGVTPPCYADAPAEAVTVTGSRVPAAPASSITNVQMRGVDEGDIVKQYGHFLVVLQDGRLFSIDTRPKGRPGLKLADRANVYRSDNEDTWYDEMLIRDDRIVVVGYSYERMQAEYSILTIDDRGHLAREATYFITADDYYSGSNYATRLVDDKLIIRTQRELRELDPDKPIKWPEIRRWRREGAGDQASGTGRPIYGARDIYRPVQATIEPVLATISVCPLGRRGAGDELECRTTAFVTSAWWTYFVSRTHAYLWAVPGYDDREWPTESGPRCQQPSAAVFENGVPGALFQVTLDSGALGFVPVRGDPLDQFSLDVDENELRALVAWNYHCEDQPLSVKYFRTPRSSFGEPPLPSKPTDYIDLPEPGASVIENRFVDGALVYGGRMLWSSRPPEQDERQASAPVVVVPIAAPRHPTVLSVPHNVIRVESVGRAAVLTGYKDDVGLSVSLVDVPGMSRVASTVELSGRYESEGRSHAYNAAIETDGSGIMGVPTVKRMTESARYVWRSKASDVSFLELLPARRLRPLGELTAREEAEHPAYKCEVSCVDWYGNTRAVFTDGRIFALAATELVEGRVDDGRIHELRRLNLTAPMGAGR